MQIQKVGDFASSPGSHAMQPFFKIINLIKFRIHRFPAINERFFDLMVGIRVGMVISNQKNRGVHKKL